MWKMQKKKWKVRMEKEIMNMVVQNQYNLVEHISVIVFFLLGFGYYFSGFFFKR